MIVGNGKPYPLGATWDGKGANFALFSEHATGVELCLFDGDGRETRLPLTRVENHVWHGYVQGIKPGQHYGFRVHGAYEPEQGHRFNPYKLLVDPYAKAIAGDFGHAPELFGYLWDAPEDEKDLSQSDTDNAHLMPKAVIVGDSFDWEGDSLLRLPWCDTAIYEVHVKGFTQSHPDIPENLRGTYAGLAHPVAIGHLQSLGITAVELLPVHHFHAHPGHLAEKGLRNYWGYDPIGYFAPYSGYSASGIQGGQVTEFKQMVKRLHAAGIEVILDVVYNHTGEGNHLGPTLSFRGIDNAVYYRLLEDSPRYSIGGYTGCGNCLNTLHPQVLKLIMDSLRHWVLDMHVDGFRFDVAPTLARGGLIEVDIWRGSKRRTVKVSDREFSPLESFFTILHQDPVLSQVKLIAEPWDCGEGGYQVGRFPLLWSEWNDKFRNTARDFWRGEGITLGEFANRLTGSPDVYKDTGRLPYASVNLITCHDGFTLHDVVSYDQKHNEDNGEDSGSNHNHSWNCGVEGETDDPAVMRLRERQKRNFLATLLLSQGVPMLLGGDEMGRSQGGNSNPYCQDNEISWFDWDLTADNAALLGFARQLIQLRRQHPLFRQRDWIRQGSAQGGIYWFDPDGSEIPEGQWQEATSAMSLFLSGEGVSSSKAQGESRFEDGFLLCFNARDKNTEFRIPAKLEDKQWRVIIDTTEPRFFEDGLFYQGSEPVIVTERSLVVLQAVAVI